MNSPATNFRNETDLRNAGYVIGSKSRLEVYRGCLIQGVDSSGGAKFGYSYGVIAAVPPELNDGDHWEYSEPFGYTESIRVEGPRLWDSGYIPAYSPDKIEGIIDSARKWIDDRLTARQAQV